MSLTPRAQAKQDQILDGARRAFLAHGFAAASTNTIAAEAGVSKQTLYAYYPSKDALLMAVLTRDFGLLHLPDFPRPGTAGELHQILTQVARAVTTHLLTADAISLLRIIVGEVYRQPGLRRKFLEALPGNLLGKVRGLFADAHARGLVQAPHPELVARLFVGSVMSYVMVDGFFGDEVPDPPGDALLEQVAVLVMRAVGEKVQREDDVVIPPL